MVERKTRLEPESEPAPTEVDLPEISASEATAAMTWLLTEPEVPAEPDAEVTDESAESEPAQVSPKAVIDPNQRYRAARLIRFQGRSGQFVVINAGSVFTSDELAFDPSAMEKIDG